MTNIPWQRDWPLLTPAEQRIQDHDLARREAIGRGSMSPDDATYEWREVALMHEASHLAAARGAGFTEAYVRLFNPAFEEGRVGRTYLAGAGDRSPLTRAVISICPSLTIVGADWDGPEFVGDRADVEAVRPAHWPPDVWTSTSRRRRGSSSPQAASASPSMKPVSRSGNRRRKS